MSLSRLLAGLDIGTTSVKAVLMTPEGEEVASGRSPTTWDGGVAGVEANPRSFTESASEALSAALSDVPSARVSAIGFASMAEAGVLVGADDEPLANVIAWHDTRDAAELEELRAELGGEEFSRRTGLPLWTQWSLTKHRWMTRNVPGTASAVRRYNIAEWVARAFGADPVSELSLASRTGWLDLASASPWQEALEWSGAPRAMLGDLVCAGDRIGSVPVNHPLRQLRGATLTIGGHDHQAAAVGTSAVGDNDELDSCGTAEALLRTVHPTVSPHDVARLAGAGVTVGWHVLRDRWCVLGATQGGLILEKLLATLDVSREALPELDRRAITAESGATQFDIVSGGHEFTMAGSAEHGDVWRAATMAVTHEVRALSDAISAATGPRADLVVTGGWANSAAVLAAKLAVLGPFRRTAAREAGARGAALLAGLAHGTYGSYADFPRAGGDRFIAAAAAQ